MVQRFSLFSLVSVAFAFVIMGCQGIGGQATKPTVIIASPPSGSVYTVGEEVVIQSTSTDPSGVVRVALLVDGNQVREDPSPVAQGQAQFSLIQSWIATGVGQHTVTIRATNTQGVTADSGILVNVKEQTGQQPTAVISIATAVPLATAVPETDVPPSSPIPTATGSTNPPVTVLVVTATSLPATEAPTATNVPTCVLNSKFIADLTIPDGTVFTPNAVFTKSWRVQNNGTCAWENFSLVFVSGTKMAVGATYPVPDTQPGGTADLTVPMTAPANYGSFTGTWRIRSSNGQLFGTNLTVVINVPSPATAVPPTNTPPPTVAGCSGQPNDFDFVASSTNITAGQSVTLSWGAVNNASEVRLNGGEFNNEGVAAPGNRVVSPASTTQYKLKALCNNSGQTREKAVTVTVNAPVGNFAGQWVHNFGTMNITQNAGGGVTGTYLNSFQGNAGTIAGNVTGNTLTGTYQIGGSSGSIEFTLSGDGKRFDGNFEGLYSWCGARPGEFFPNGCSYAGHWTTEYGDGPTCQMDLKRKDNQVTGTYCNGTINGTVSYDVNNVILTGQWRISIASSGPIKYYIFGFNALKFTGNWGDASHPWCGWRDGQAQPAPCYKP